MAQENVPSTSNSFEILGHTLDNPKMNGAPPDAVKGLAQDKTKSIPEPILEQIIVRGDDQTIEDDEYMEIELDKRELVGIDLASLEEAYHK